MGARKSLKNNEKASQKETIEVSRIEACKRQRTSSSFCNENPRLFPSLPDEISIQILARLPRLWHFNAKQVSRSWKATIMSDEIYRLRKELGTTEEWLYVLTRISHYKFMWLALDPVYQIWQRLPPMHDHATEDCSRRGLSGFRMRNSVDPSSRVAGGIEGWLGLKDMCQIPYSGCDICAVNGCLYVLGGFCRRTVMRSVWRYDPGVNSWSEVAPMCTSRAYCNTSVLNNKLYAVGGVARAKSGRSRLMIPLQCAEVFDPCSGTWSKIPSMPFSKARTLPTSFPPELVKPIATGMTSYRGKIYVRQSLSCRPHCIDAGGEVYDPESNSWVDMAIGLGKGWPVRQADTKPCVIVVDEELYALDRSDSVDNAQIKVYNHQDDAWKAIEGDVPDRNLTDPRSPFLLAGLLGKLHVITKDVNHNIKVMQADRQKNQFASASIGESWRELPTRSPESIWKLIATRHAGQDHELVSCQVLRY